MIGRMTQPYKTKLNNQNFLSAADVAVTAGQFTEVARYQVPAGEIMCLGFGNAGSQESAVGRLYCQLLSTGGGNPEINGSVRIELRDAQDRLKTIIYEDRTEALSAKLITAKQTQDLLPFPFINAGVKQDSAIVMTLNPDANDTVDVSISTVLIDSTRFTHEW
jgi:hypothetical protein